jgi:hypothetical protein
MNAGIKWICRQLPDPGHKYKISALFRIFLVWDNIYHIKLHTCTEAVVLMYVETMSGCAGISMSPTKPGRAEIFPGDQRQTDAA